MTEKYKPDPVAADAVAEQLATYMLREFQRISDALDQLQPTALEVLTAEPTKKHEFLTVAADGFHWNPGSGKGIYTWFDGRWNVVSATGSLPPQPITPGPAPVDQPPLSDLEVTTGGVATPTFHCVGIVWVPPSNPGVNGAPMDYKRSEDATWIPAYPLWYDGRTGECKGSIVGLEPNTDYDVRFGVTATPTHGLRFRTWNEVFPEGTVTTLPSGVRSTTLTIDEGGTASAYRVYRAATPGDVTIDPNNNSLFCIHVKASYVIIRNFTLRRPQSHCIRLAQGVHDVVIENNNMSEWGRPQGTITDSGLTFTRGANMECAVFSAAAQNRPDPDCKRIVIQRNTIHDPRYGSNSWALGHPSGPQAICLWESGGNHVIRYNNIYSTGLDHYFNDGLGGGENFSEWGFPGPDSDIYQNIVKNCWDDGIEVEGSGRNVRVFKNYIDSVAIGIATTVVQHGPLYSFRNVLNRCRTRPDRTLDNDNREKAFKSHTLSSWGRGRLYAFHNTTLQVPPSGAPGNTSFPLGCGTGLSGGGGQPLTNTVSRNNIWHVWKRHWQSIRLGTDPTNDLNYDLYNGTVEVPSGGEASGIRVDPTGQDAALPLGPVYKEGHGPEADGIPLGRYQLDVGSPGHDAGQVLNNFSAGFLGAAPDMGAHEEGTSDMIFGPTS